jgi:hypothetical protein
MRSAVSNSAYSRSTYSNSAYLAAALALVGAVLVALWLFAPQESRPGDWKAAGTRPTPSAPVDGSAFRYGPEIKHGSSDAAVSARAQALNEARGMASDQGRAYSERRRSGTVTFFNRGLSSGH